MQNRFRPRAAQAQSLSPQPVRFYKWILICTAMLTLAVTPAANAVTRYVNAALLTGANNGTSWADAYRGQDGLVTAITAAVASDEIWVATGSYRPTSTGVRSISFNLKTGVAIYGGFVGTETLLSQRDPATNITRLTGDLLGNDGAPGTFLNDTENSNHVVNGAGATATAILDGFLVTGGNANVAASDLDRGGGAIFVTASNGTVRNCRIEYNRCTFGGGALYIRLSSPAFSDVTCLGNQGGAFGGACDMATNCNPSFQRCSFISNSAARAGGVEIFGTSAPTLVNCLFRANQATGATGGGALFIASSSSPVLTNCTIVSNSGTMNVGGVLTTSNSTPNLRNCIIWANSGPGGSMALAQQVTHSGTGSTTVSYSDVMNGPFAGTGNIAVDPQFVDLAVGKLRLTATSPCIDAANSTIASATDFDGNPRVVDIPTVPNTGIGAVDMGAYEFQLADCAGDLDCDGDRDINDTAAFVLAVIDPAGYGLAFPTCDINEADLDANPGIDGRDIAPFVDLLLSGPCP